MAVSAMFSNATLVCTTGKTRLTVRSCRYLEEMAATFNVTPAELVLAAGMPLSELA